MYKLVIAFLIDFYGTLSTGFFCYNGTPLHHQSPSESCSYKPTIRTIYPELPPGSEYRITEPGFSLLPIIDVMLKWGEDHFDIFEKKYGRQ